MGQDEEAPLRTLSAHRKIIDVLIDQGHRRFVTSAGDSVLAEFASVVEAVNCVVEIIENKGESSLPAKFSPIVISRLPPAAILRSPWQNAFETGLYLPRCIPVNRPDPPIIARYGSSL
jgi:hypothetical protein